MKKFAFVISIGFTFLLISCGDSVNDPVVTVTTQIAVNATIPEELLLTGILEPVRKTNIASRINGRVLSVLYNEGNRVPKGSVIMKLDPSIETTLVYGSLANLKQAIDSMEKINAMYDERIASSKQNIKNLRDALEKSVDITEIKLKTGKEDIRRNTRLSITNTSLLLENVNDTIDQLLGITSKYQSPRVRIILKQHLGVLKPSSIDSAKNAFYDMQDSFIAFRTFYDTYISKQVVSVSNLNRGLYLSETALINAKSALESSYDMLLESVPSASFAEQELNEKKSIILSLLDKVANNISEIRTLRNRGALPEQISILEKSLEQVELNTKEKLERAEFDLDVLIKEKDAKIAEMQSVITRLKSENNLQNVQLSNTIVIAPYDGVIIEKSVEEGDVVSPSETLMTIADDSMLKLVVSIPDNLISLLKIGKKATITVDGINKKNIVAEINKIYPSADSSSKKINIELILNNSDRQIKSGMFARVNFSLATGSGVIIPTSSVISRYGRNFVFLAEDKTAVLKPITIAKRTNKFVSVSNGIVVGDEVIIKGNIYLREGDTIQKSEAL